MLEYPRRSWRWFILPFVFAAALGCAKDPDQSEPEPTSPANQPVKQVPRAQASWSRTIADVDWKAARLHPSIPPSSLPASLRTKFAQAPVPALVPNEPQMLSSGKATQGPTWYALSMPLVEHTVFVSGNRTETFVPGVSDTVMPRPDFEPRISRSRGIVSATFRAFGVAYVVEVECARPFEDSRCTEDAYVTSLVNQLAVAGGAS